VAKNQVPQDGGKMLKDSRSSTIQKITWSMIVLKDLLRVTDGNLSVHARKLERRPWLDFDWMGGRNGVVGEGKGVIEIMIGLAAN
jgi:hypothetical protein